MRLRIVTVAVAATLAVAGLAGCRTNVGTAATVSGHRISESDVSSYVAKGGIDPSVAAQAKANGGIKSPRSQVLQFLIEEQIFEKTLRSLGDLPSAGQLSGLHDEAAAFLSQTQLKGKAFDDEIRSELVKTGIESKFVDVFLRVQELEYVLIKRERLTQLSDLLALIKKAKVTVSVNPRYGKWDTSTLSLDGKPAVPSYLSRQPTPNAAAANQPAG